jgi:hypothetical protein
LYSLLTEKRETVRATHNRKKLLWGLLGAVCGIAFFYWLFVLGNYYLPGPNQWQRLTYFTLLVGGGGLGVLLWFLSESATATDTEIIVRKGLALYRARWEEIEDYGIEISTFHPMLILKNGKRIRLGKTWINLPSLQNVITQRTPYVKAGGIWLPLGLRPHELPYTFAYGAVPPQLKQARKVAGFGFLGVILFGILVLNPGVMAGLSGFINNLYTLSKGYKNTRHLPERFQVDSEGITVSGVPNGRLYPWAEITSIRREGDWIKTYDRLGILLFEFSIYLPNANALLAAIQYKIDTPHTPINFFQPQSATPQK